MIIFINFFKVILFVMSFISVHWESDLQPTFRYRVIIMCLDKTLFSSQGCLAAIYDQCLLLLHSNCWNTCFKNWQTFIYLKKNTNIYMVKLYITIQSVLYYFWLGLLTNQSDFLLFHSQQSYAVPKAEKKITNCS